MGTLVFYAIPLIQIARQFALFPFSLNILLRFLLFLIER